MSTPGSGGYVLWRTYFQHLHTARPIAATVTAEARGVSAALR